MKQMQRLYSLLFILTLSAAAAAQVVIPRESNRQDVMQMVGDTKISVSYHRPNVKGRKIWGELVPYGEVWRTGANNATIIEFSNDVTVNGQPLKKGKYSLHTLPTAANWTIIFNKVADQWGSFTYDAKEDVLRVEATPVSLPFKETMTIEFAKVIGNTAEIHIRWGDLAVPITVDVGDFNARFVTENRRRLNNERLTLAGYILSQKMTGSYADALLWTDEALKGSETFSVLSLKARILGEMGRKAEAIATAERAIVVGKAATPAANTTQIENLLKGWKAGN
ncbi:MAG: DUF2911 domain-containing protein [Blastocatellia bacterium]|nr:DUF2911 domain-containing protein [Chloracidobacterium sp.]MBL8184821.1 DUF2911 domain-containing protein [Blastocatellia bacterium]HRJ89153.1 DUF2911 domain-containing protein [Pyrinomonadaceae bacterium]HRK50136.1 DUF2911 domain-containing protein [Pyrinomonadaceae bacterium]